MSTNPKAEHAVSVPSPADKALLASRNATNKLTSALALVSLFLCVSYSDTRDEETGAVLVDEYVIRDGLRVVSDLLNAALNAQNDVAALLDALSKGGPQS